MGLIQEGDFVISYKNNNAYVYHILTKQEFIGNNGINKYDNLKIALEKMEKALKKKKE